MKKNVIYLLLSIALWSCNHRQPYFTIEGTIEGVNDSTEIVISYLTQNEGKWIDMYDTTYLSDSKFYFGGSINELTAGYLFFDNQEIPIYIEPATINLVIDNDDLFKYKISGISIEKENNELQNLLSDEMKKYFQIADSMQAVFKEIDIQGNNSALVDTLTSKAHRLKSELIIKAGKIEEIRLDFVAKHNTFKIAPHLLYILAKNAIVSNDTLVAVYNNLPKEFQTSLLGRLAMEQINESRLSLNREEIKIGDIAPDFSRKNIDGKVVRLNDFKNNNYVLIDFWASWCSPCLRQIPQIKKMQDIYAPKGLAIIGVSLDNNEQEWLSTIKKNQMNTWNQVLSWSNPNDTYFYKETDIQIVYGISSIPLYILIDKQGKILSKWQHVGDNEIAFIDSLLH